MTEKDTKKIEDYMGLIDYENVGSILSFGSEVQEKLADLSKLIVSSIDDSYDAENLSGIDFKKGNLEMVEASLDECRMNLLMESALLDRMKKMNEEYANELILLTEAARNKLLILKKDKKDVMGRKSINYVAGFITKKIESLELSKEVARQQEGQLELLAASVITMAESIQTIIYTTIPSFKGNVISEKMLSKEVEGIRKGCKSKQEKAAKIKNAFKGLYE